MAMVPWKGVIMTRTAELKKLVADAMTLSAKNVVLCRMLKRMSYPDIPQVGTLTVTEGGVVIGKTVSGRSFAAHGITFGANGAEWGGRLLITAAGLTPPYPLDGYNEIWLLP